MKTSAGIAEYLKRAFLYRWNLLLFLGATAAAAISPFPDALIPLVLAAEVAYLGGLVSRPHFRDAIDAQVHQEAQHQEVAGIAGGDREFAAPAVASTIRCAALAMPGDEVHRARGGRTNARRRTI